MNLPEHTAPFNPVFRYPGTQVVPEGLGEFRLFSVQFNDPRNGLQIIKGLMQGCVADAFCSGFLSQSFQPSGEILGA